jgi:hypothetical protein
VSLGVALLTVSAFGSQRTPNPPVGSRLHPRRVRKVASRALIDQYCTNCHNPDDKVAGLDLQSMNLDQIAEGAETWEKVVKKTARRNDAAAGSAQAAAGRSR